MAKHVVMWRFTASAQGHGRAEFARIVKSKIEALQSKDHELLYLELRIDFAALDASADMVLRSELADRSPLEAGQGHPEHLAAVAINADMHEERRLAD